MAEYEKDPNASIGGNKIYQELATQVIYLLIPDSCESHLWSLTFHSIQNPRHTYQSYRDRYRRRLRGLPRPGGMPKPNPPASAEKDGNQQATKREQSSPRSHRMQSQDDNPVIHMLGDKKRKRTPEHNPDLELNGVHLTSQKRRAIDKTPKELIPTMIHAQQSKSPHLERTPTSSISVDNEAHIAHDPVTNISEPVQYDKTETSDHDPENAIDPLFLELPFLPSSPEPEPEEPPEQDIDTWIDHRLQTGRAENEEQIIEALRCTSMDPYLADQVLDYLIAGKGIPDNMPGVWTAEDDRCLEAKETRTIEQVLKKHGSDAFNSRWEYLGMARAAGLDDIDS